MFYVVLARQASLFPIRVSLSALLRLRLFQCVLCARAPRVCPARLSCVRPFSFSLALLLCWLPASCFVCSRLFRVLACFASLSLALARSLAFCCYSPFSLFPFASLALCLVLRFCVVPRASASCLCGLALLFVSVFVACSFAVSSPLATCSDFLPCIPRPMSICLMFASVRVFVAFGST